MSGSCECCCSCVDLLEWLQDEDCKESIKELLQEDPIDGPAGGGGGGGVVMVFGGNMLEGSGGGGGGGPEDPGGTLPRDNNAEYPCGQVPWTYWYPRVPITPIAPTPPKICVDEFGNDITPKKFGG